VIAFFIYSPYTIAMFTRTLFRLAFIAALMPLSAGAQTTTTTQTTKYQKISAGTGFILNRDGDVVTNAHVLNACESIAVRVDGTEQPATLRARDDEHDLALLRISAGNRDGTMAPLRWNISELKVGDPVVLMGYPGKGNLEGRAVVKKTSVTNLNGPAGEPKWIQLSSVAEHGNSGGPVLDTSGNVIGVMAALSKTYRVDAQGNKLDAPIGEADVAITLSSLRDFLKDNQVSYYEATSGLVAYADSVIEENAKKFIVPIHCNQGMVTQN